MNSATRPIYTSLRRKLDLTASKCREYEQAINRENTKAIHGIKDVKVAKTERVFLQDYLQNSYPFTRYFGGQQFLKQLPMLLLESAGFIMLCGSICLMLLVMNVSAATITGTIALLAVTAWRALPALNRIVQALTNIRTALPYVASIQNYFQEMQDHLPDSTAEPKADLSFLRVRLQKFCLIIAQCIKRSSMLKSIITIMMHQHLQGCACNKACWFQ